MGENTKIERIQALRGDGSELERVWLDVEPIKSGQIFFVHKPHPVDTLPMDLIVITHRQTGFVFARLYGVVRAIRLMRRVESEYPVEIFDINESDIKKRRALYCHLLPLFTEFKVQM